MVTFYLYQRKMVIAKSNNHLCTFMEILKVQNHKSKNQRDSLNNTKLNYPRLTSMSIQSLASILPIETIHQKNQSSIKLWIYTTPFHFSTTDDQLYVLILANLPRSWSIVFSS